MLIVLLPLTYPLSRFLPLFALLALLVPACSGSHRSVEPDPCQDDAPPPRLCAWQCESDADCPSGECNKDWFRCKAAPEDACYPSYGCVTGAVCVAERCEKIGDGRGGTPCAVGSDCESGACGNNICVGVLGGACSPSAFASLDTACAAGSCLCCEGEFGESVCECSMLDALDCSCADGSLCPMD